jgi:ADP-heptose:LPS heptosyltransferase
VERNLRLIEAVGIRVADRRLAIQPPQEACRGAAERLAVHGLSLETPYLLLSPWASCTARTYFIDRFATAARQLSQRTGWPVLVTGAVRDQERAGPLLAALDSHGVNLVGATTIPELAALVANARLVLTNDSLPMHLADATQTPSVVLYSGTEYESQWQPRHSPFRLLRRPTPCSPCYAFTCPYNLECLDIPPEEVVAAGLELLDGP